MKKILEGILITVAGLLAGLVAAVVGAMILGSVWDGLEDGPDGWFSQVVGLVLISLALGGGVYGAWKITKREKGKAIQRTAQSPPPGNYLPSDSSTTQEEQPRADDQRNTRPPFDWSIFFSWFSLFDFISNRNKRKEGYRSTSHTYRTSEASAQSKTNDVTKSKPAQYCAIGCLVVAVVAVGLIVTCVAYFSGTPELSDADKAAKAEEKRKGFHCMSTYDGNHDGLERLIKARLKDPDSMDTIETRITPVDANGDHAVFLKYRARNSFGGMVVEQALGIVDNDTCEATLLGVE
jgi:hypothetical protein